MRFYWKYPFWCPLSSEKCYYVFISVLLYESPSTSEHAYQLAQYRCTRKNFVKTVGQNNYNYKLKKIMALAILIKLGS